MSDASREMTLKEWMDCLSDGHTARREYDALRAQVADLGAAYGAEHRAVLAAHAELTAFKEATGKVTCEACGGSGISYGIVSCPDCADLRRLLEKQP